MCIAQSRATFIAKLAIVIEETDESYFWIEFAADEKLVKKGQVAELMQEAQELTAIFVASQKRPQDVTKNENYIQLTI